MVWRPQGIERRRPALITMNSTFKFSPRVSPLDVLNCCDFAVTARVIQAVILSKKSSKKENRISRSRSRTSRLLLLRCGLRRDLSRSPAYRRPSKAHAAATESPLVSPPDLLLSLYLNLRPHPSHDDRADDIPPVRVARPFEQQQTRSSQLARWLGSAARLHPDPLAVPVRYEAFFRSSPPTPRWQLDSLLALLQCSMCSTRMSSSKERRTSRETACPGKILSRREAASGR